MKKKSYLSKNVKANMYWYLAFRCFCHSKFFAQDFVNELLLGLNSPFTF